MLKKSPGVFEEGLGTFKATTAKIVVESNACFKHCKARLVLYVIIERIKKELKKLEDEGTID